MNDNTPTQLGWYWVRPPGGDWVAVRVEDSVPAGNLHVYVPSTTRPPGAWWRPIGRVPLDWGPRIPTPDEYADQIAPQ